jgi:superfamily II RNA helicase
VSTRLEELVIEGGGDDAVLERFLTWIEGRYELYPAQEEAILELMGSRHVILNTPTGSGKSLVALAMHFKGLCEGARSVYTSPIKALVSEKFFDLCEELGPGNVGMLTGDASINPKAPVVCCTAEVLANMAARDGRYTQLDYVIMDEFHFYGDRDRGVAWQIPLLELLDATFLLMSATLGDMTEHVRRMQARTGREVAWVRSRERPVPLDYEYRETPLHRTVEELVQQGRAPIYLVNFTQREAAEQAQNLTSLNVATKQDKKAVADAIAGFRFDTTYGKDVKRFARQGIGVHHAGLLPKYRLLVEQLAQKGLLKVISGTDTLGVGVNIPIRTVLFTKLYKFDGARTRVLSVRNFQQIAGRAGRKGFDDRGSVVCQAPEHVIENKLAEQKAAREKRKPKFKKKPARGFVHYDQATFKRLVESEAEPLRSRFQVSHGLLMNVLEREVKHGVRDGGYGRLVGLIGASDESERARSRHRRRAAELFRALRGVGIVELVTPEWDSRPYARVKEGLQREFSLHQTLSLFLVEALARLDPEAESYSLDLLTLVEAILESPQVVLFRQVDKLKTEALAVLKAEGVDYEQRMEELDRITHPQPDGELISEWFEEFRLAHPWVGHEVVQPKSIARDMVERYASFNTYVQAYGLQRSEGVLLRYLSSAYKALAQTVPEELKTGEVLEIQAFLRTTLAHTDASLVKEWESMLVPSEEREGEPPSMPVVVRPDLTSDPRTFLARVRAEVHRLVKALADRDYSEAAASVYQPDAESYEEAAWPPERFEEELARFYDAHESILFNHRARLSELTQIKQLDPRRWQVLQTLVDPEEENLWGIEALVDLNAPDAGDGPLLRVQRISG